MMGKTWQIAAAIAILSVVPLSAGDVASDAGYAISGKYLEVRTSDVWTGPCFANGEVNLTGKEGILAWKVERGGWNGVPLQGLKVAAVVRGDATLGDPFAEASLTRSVILVDETASSRQQAALVDFARSMSGSLLEEVVDVKTAQLDMEAEMATGSAFLKAGELASIKTRALNHHDMHCGNETVYYPPLTDVRTMRPAYALEHRFNGKGLGSTWSCPSKRSAFIGSFSQ